MDTLNLQACLPQEKLHNLTQFLKVCTSKRSISIQKWQSLTGHLSFATTVVRLGRPFIWKLIDRTHGITNPHHHIKVTGEIHSDCNMWLKFLQDYNGISLISPMRDISYSHLAFASGASNWGFAAVLHNECFQAEWPLAWKGTHINMREFVPIFLALHVWGTRWSHAILTFHCDNQVVVDVISKNSSRDPGMLVVLQEVALFFASARHHSPSPSFAWQT